MYNNQFYLPLSFDKVFIVFNNTFKATKGYILYIYIPRIYYVLPMLVDTENIQEHAIHGPFNWLAPEILNGDGPTVKSDVYSLCTVLWEVLHS